VLIEVFLVNRDIEDWQAVERKDLVVGLETGLFGRRSGRDPMHDQFIARRNADFAKPFIAREPGIKGNLKVASSTLDGEYRHRVIVVVASGAGDERLHQARPIVNLDAVDGSHDVADLETGLRGGAGRLHAVAEFDGGAHIADSGGGHVAADRFADEPDHAGEHKGEKEVHGGAGGENDNLGQVADRRQRLGVGRAFTLDDTHVRELREGDVAADRQP
jgi:hypothetical protein